jgi:hypothetical protein
MRATRDPIGPLAVTPIGQQNHPRQVKLLGFPEKQCNDAKFDFIQKRQNFLAIIVSVLNYNSSTQGGQYWQPTSPGAYLRLQRL